MLGRSIPVTSWMGEVHFSEGDGTLTARLFPPIPSDTVKAVRPVFGESNFYVVTGDLANQLFNGLMLCTPKQAGQKPARTLAELYLITIFQYLETMPDSQAADAMRYRRDWKYALHLPLNVLGFPTSAFCEFRRLLLSDRDSLQTLQALLERLAEVGASINGEGLSMEAGQIVSRVCLLSRLAIIRQAFSQALQALAIMRPDWLRLHSLPHWYERYSSLHTDQYLGADPSEQERLAQAIGADGFYLLEAVASTEELKDLPEVHTLNQVWREQFDPIYLEGVKLYPYCYFCGITQFKEGG